MKCIKKKCRYCQPHEYRLSYYYCELDGGGGFHKDSNRNCHFDDIIKEHEQTLCEFKDYKRFIEPKQNS